MKFLKTETHTPVLLWNDWEVRIWVSTVSKLTSRKTEIARSACGPKSQGLRAEDGLPRAENFGDLITADQKIVGEGCVSRNDHRYAVVVQDLATQWIQSYPRKAKTSQETERSLQRFLEPDRKPKVIYTDNSMEFGKACEDLSWNHCTSTPHRSQTNGRLLREQCADWKKVPLLYCCNQVSMKVGGQILWNVTPICETSQIYYLMGRRSMKDVLGNHLKGPHYSIWFIG